jgi:hypothetical protein
MVGLGGSDGGRLVAFDNLEARLRLQADEAKTILGTEGGWGR